MFRYVISIREDGRDIVLNIDIALHFKF